ncbi:MAG: hypothetical protein ABIA37_03460 [Candidatus Woesearchaeota archaeon]
MNEMDIGRNMETQAEKEEMQQIDSAVQETEEKESGKSVLMVLLVLFGIVALSFGGFKVYTHFTGADVINIDDLHQQNLEGDLNNKEGYMYEGFSFVYVDGLWWTEIQQGNVLYKVPLHFGPKEVDQVKIEGKLDPLFNNGSEVYMAIDPEFANKYYNLALSELNFNVARGIGKKPIGVCTWNKTGVCDDREIYSCNNTQGKPVIELQYGGESKITSSGTCILISGEEYALVKAVDRLIWQWYHVMK